VFARAALVASAIVVFWCLDQLLISNMQGVNLRSLCLMAVVVGALTFSPAPQPTATARFRSRPTIFAGAADDGNMDDATFRREAVRPYVISTKIKAGATREVAEAEADAFLADPESAAFVSRFRDIIAEQAQVIGAAMTS
jgi:hypothetical protein